MNPPDNPHAAEQRAAVQAHMAQARGVTYPPPAPAEPAPPAKQAALYPIDCRLPIVYMECHDDGVWIWTDDPVAMYSVFK